MLYSDAAIQTLVDRVGWAPPIPPSTIGVTDAVTASTSGRYAKSFHRYATVENMAACMANAYHETDGFVNELLFMRRQAVLKVLAEVFDNNDRAFYRTGTQSNAPRNLTREDYDRLIALHSSRFDDAIGYQLAWDALEVIVTSTRTNAEKSILQLQLGSVLSEKDGFYDQNGTLVSPGLSAKRAKAIQKVIDILFPAERSKNRLYDASHKW